MNNYYETTDLGLAASLTASGFAVVDVNRNNPRRVVFAFNNSPELQIRVEQFWANKLLLPAGTLMEQIRQLKTRIYS